MNKLLLGILLTSLFISSCVSQQKQLETTFSVLKGKYWSLNNLIVNNEIFATATEEGFDAVPTPFIRFNENGEIWIKLDETINGKGKFQLNGNTLKITEDKCTEKCKLSENCDRMNELFLLFLKKDNIIYEISESKNQLKLKQGEDIVQFYHYKQ